jgi:O-antigen ligase
MIFRTAVNDAVYERGDNFFEQVTQGGNYFFGEFISPFIHNTYYGMYLSLGVAVAFALLRLANRRILIVPIVLMLITLVFVDSRGAMISFALAVLIASTTMIKRKYVVVIAIILLGIIYISPRTNLLIKDLRQTVNNLNYNTTESAGLRLIIWRSSFEVIKENFLAGVGTGDSEAAMLEKTKVSNKLAYESHLNAHNQFLETTMTHGIVGLLLILALLGYPLYVCFKYRDWLFMVFILIVSGNMLFESIFQTFSGLMFFSFFVAVFTLFLQKKLYEDPSPVTSR